MNKIVICHSRHDFYNKPVWWYEFWGKKGTSLIPLKFLNVPETPYYEYGGTHDEALKDLGEFGFEIIINKTQI